MEHKVSPFSYSENDLKEFERHPFVKERIDWLRTHTTGSILDVGCGCGSTLYAITEYDTLRRDIAGIDLEWDYLQAARDLFQMAKFYYLDVTENCFPFESSSFDTVVLSEILEHIRPFQSHHVIEEAYRVCKRKVLITTPNGSSENYYAAAVESANHSMIYTKEIFERFLNPQTDVKEWYESTPMRKRPMSKYNYTIEEIGNLKVFLGVTLRKES